VLSGNREVLMNYLGFVIEQLGQESDEVVRARRHHRRRREARVERRSRRLVRRTTTEL
jgi:hypothetical protein